MLTVLPLAYFGSIGYFQQLLVPGVVIDVNEYFIKQTDRSRCEILTANGRLHLSIPVSKPNGSKTLVKDLLISYATDWQRIHWKALESAYASSTFFEEYAHDIENLINSNFVYLKDLNLASIDLVNKWLDLKLNYRISECYLEGKNVNDFRTKDYNQLNVSPYFQLFNFNNNLERGLSILDLIFSEGPMSRKWLLK